MKNLKTNQAQTKIYTVSPNDLPLSCPTPQVELWCMHPKVFLPIEKTKYEICPYCGTHFQLQN